MFAPFSVFGGKLFRHTAYNIVHPLGVTRVDGAQSRFQQEFFAQLFPGVARIELELPINILPGFFEQVFTSLLFYLASTIDCRVENANAKAELDL